MRGWLLIACALLLTACALGPPIAATPSAERAAAATRRGDHAAAANLYEQTAAQRSGSEQAGLLLAAATEWLAAQRGPEAARVLAAISVPLDPGQTRERRTLEAEADLVSSRAQEAWQKIDALAEPATPDAALRYLDLRRRIAFAAARPIDGVRAEIAAERYAASTEQRTQLRSALLADLRSARVRGVKLEPQATRDPTVRGWLDLGAIASGARPSSIVGGSDLSQWRARYPGHPATELLAQAFSNPLTGVGTVRRIALLLPLTGGAGAAAATVRDGFQAAIRLLPPEERPVLIVYDTGILPVPEAIGQARDDGADVIVGPLTREEVTLAADVGTRGLPLLALNFLDAQRIAPAGMYQFALSPEEEARSVATRLLQSGLRRGVAMVPTGDWGNRVLAAFREQFVGGGGTLLAQVSYDAAIHDYGTEIRSTFGPGASLARKDHIASITGLRLAFEPRPRADIDFAFVAGQPASVRLLRPQLRFYYAGNMGIYSTSDAFAPDAGASNQDLDGLMFPEMPWLLPGDGYIGETRLLLDAAMGPAAVPRSRLYAFGYDACQLALALGANRREPTRIDIAGLTGRLTMGADGRVHRETSWAQIRDGAVEPLQP